MTYTVDERFQKYRLYFTDEHLYLKYLPPKVLPLTLVVLVAVFIAKNEPALVIGALAFVVFVAANIRSKYIKCWRKHADYKKRYRMKYMNYFHDRIEKDGFDVLISSYFSDVKPPFEDVS